MGEDNRVTKRSCPFCQHPSRDELEEALLSGSISPKELDKKMKQAEKWNYLIFARVYSKQAKEKEQS